MSFYKKPLYSSGKIVKYPLDNSTWGGSGVPDIIGRATHSSKAFQLLQVFATYNPGSPQQSNHDEETSTSTFVLTRFKNAGTSGFNPVTPVPLNPNYTSGFSTGDYTVSGDETSEELIRWQIIMRARPLYHTFTVPISFAPTEFCVLTLETADLALNCVGHFLLKAL